jgi:hypothetical protein
MQIGKLLRFPFFLSSYSPLWLIFLTSYLIQKFELLQKDNLDKNSLQLLQILFSNVENLIVLIIFVVLITIPLIILIWYINNRIKENPKEFKIKTKINMTNEYILYVITYIFPFISEDIIDLSNLFSLVIVIITLGILYIGANLYYVNPTLSILGYKLYRITDDSDNELVLLSKMSAIPQNKSIMINEINENIYIQHNDIDEKI